MILGKPLEGIIGWVVSEDINVKANSSLKKLITPKTWDSIIESVGNPMWVLICRINTNAPK